MSLDNAVPLQIRVNLRSSVDKDVFLSLFHANKFAPTGRFFWVLLVYNLW